MKLSEAIRLGAMSTEQAFGMLISYDKLRACAIGAACVAVGLDVNKIDSTVNWTPVFDRFPILKHKIPSPNGPQWDISCEIITMNDTERKSRQEIADYVEKIENEIEERANAKEEILVGA